MKSHRLALIFSLPAMVLIWIFVIGLLGGAVREWKGMGQHSVIHVVAIVTLIALGVLIPVQIIQSIRREIKHEHENGRRG
jgi:hypothetical protein